MSLKARYNHHPKHSRPETASNPNKDIIFTISAPQLIPVIYKPRSTKITLNLSKNMTTSMGFTEPYDRYQSNHIKPKQEDDH